MKPKRVRSRRSGEVSEARQGRRGFLQLGTSAALGLGLGACAKEGPFPSRAITVLVPYGAGGGTDLEARAIAPYLQRQLGVPIVIDNQPGADGRVGLSRFARQPADGYRVAVYGIPSMILGEVLNDTAYRVRDFTHLFAWIEEPEVLVARAGAWPDFPAFLQDARTRTRAAGVTYLTSAARLAGLALSRSSGVEFTWVPFGAAGQALAALLGGHVDFCITALKSCLSLVEAGQLEALLVFAEQRTALYPDAPVPAEFGLKTSTLPIVRGAVAPAGLDPEVAARLEAGFAAAAQDPEFLGDASRSRTQVRLIGSAAYMQLVEDYYEEIAGYDDAALRGPREG